MSEVRRDLAGMLAVAATYLYFLLFAQFGFLGQLKTRLGNAADLETVMLAMGLAGLASSLAAGAWLKRIRPGLLLRVGFAGCAASALVSQMCTRTWQFAATGFLIGTFTGILTVALATELRTLVGGRHFGLKVGVATGIAYWICNLPFVFDATPPTQATISALVCIAGLVCVGAASSGERATGDARSGRAVERWDCRGLGFAMVVLSFLVLIWLDSAAFAIIQESPELKGLTWGRGWQTATMGTVHFVAAAVAGRLIDRGLFGALLLGTFGLFATSISLMSPTVGWGSITGPLYAIAVSGYSVALVVYPSQRGTEEGLVPTRWRAAWLFGVAGWVGSALGVGMAQNLHRVPPTFLWTTGLVILVGRLFALRPGPARAARTYGGVLLFAALAGAIGWIGSEVHGLPPDPEQDGYAATLTGDSNPAIARGRRVYIDEGCINCHSQYIRPHTRDVELWGPFREVDFDEQPPLIGNRRQGPDLMNVGNRRSAEWQRVHLMDPGILSPGSRMPSYRHLFFDGTTRGDDLVAYLGSLGDETRLARLALVRSYPREALPAGSSERGASLFQSYCKSCHGQKGRGNGSLAPTFGMKPMDLRWESERFVAETSLAGPAERVLARIVKFGIQDTSMPGHETFAPQEIADLVGFVSSLRVQDDVASARHGDSR